MYRVLSNFNLCCSQCNLLNLFLHPTLQIFPHVCIQDFLFTMSNKKYYIYKYEKTIQYYNTLADYFSNLIYKKKVFKQKCLIYLICKQIKRV